MYVTEKYPVYPGGRTGMKKYCYQMSALLIAGMILASGCITIQMPPSPQNTSQDSLVGEWKMIRTGISPALPVPELLVNQLISDKPTWKIIRESTGLLKITYDGSDTWYKSLGTTSNKQTTTVTEGSAHNSCTFSSGGGIYLESIPSIPGLSPRMEQISITYTDSVLTVYMPSGKLDATITVHIQGKYYGETEYGGAMTWKNIDSHKSVISYTGTRK